MAQLNSHNANPLQYMEFLGKPRGGFWYGVEIEFEVNQDYGVEMRGDGILESMSRGFCMLKRDGSLDRGLEIVTAPAPLARHRIEWKKFWDARRKGFFVGGFAD